MARALTKKQRGFVKDYLATGNGTAAVKKNYAVANEKVAGVMASENLGKPSIVKSIQEALSDALLLEKHTALLEKMDERGGIDVPAVSKGLDMAYKIKGTYAPEKNVNINIETEASDEIKALTEKLNAIHRGAGVSSHGGASGTLGPEA